MEEDEGIGVDTLDQCRLDSEALHDQGLEDGSLYNRNIGDAHHGQMPLSSDIQRGDQDRLVAGASERLGDTELTLSASGDDAAEAVDHLATLVAQLVE